MKNLKISFSEEESKKNIKNIILMEFRFLKLLLILKKSLRLIV